MVAAAGGVERRRVHHSPHRCPSALSSGRSESALAACLAWGAAGALPTEEIVSACFGAACFSADSVAGERLVVVAIGGIGGRGMGGISTRLPTGTANSCQQRATQRAQNYGPCPDLFACKMKRFFTVAESRHTRATHRAHSAVRRPPGSARTSNVRGSRGTSLVIHHYRLAVGKF